MNVMLLAAGEGTRLRPHTLNLPKPAIPFLNIPLVCYSLYFLESAGVDKLVVNTYHLPDKMKASVQNLSLQVKELHFSEETQEILGSGGGLKKAEKFFQGGGDFVLMNADEIIIPEDPQILSKTLSGHKAADAIATLFVMDYPGVGTKFGGVWCKDKNVLGFGKEPVAGSDRAWHFIGAQILNERVFNYLPSKGPSNILYDALKEAIAAGEKVRIQPISCSWFETGNPHDFLEALTICTKDLEKKNHNGLYLEKVLKRFAGENIQIQSNSRFTAVIANSAKVASDVQLEGFVTIGSGCLIPKACHLKNVVIGADVVLSENTNIADQIVLSAASKI